MEEVEQLKEKIISLLSQVIDKEIDLSTIVPHAAFAPLGAHFATLSSEKRLERLKKGVAQIEQSIPQDKKIEVLTKMAQRIEDDLKHYDYRKDRLTRRIQPEDKPREPLPPFKSFCKRKGTW